ncbi:hypothetical protein GXW82_22875 [Streptacidiphilus sp. 4-A2]|nr:hypothetical protein [Streptacidiphilus sp. 4-A2]
MRHKTLSIAVIAGLALLAVPAAAPAAFASGSSGASAASVTVSPAAVHPGDTVQIQLDCSAYSSPKPTWGSQSEFSGPVDLRPMSGQPGFYSASAEISASLGPGSYTLSGSCAAGDSSSSFQADLTISSSDGQMPSGPAHTGVGGSITGGDLAQEAGGAALVLAAGALALRHRRSRDGG